MEVFDGLSTVLSKFYSKHNTLSSDAMNNELLWIKEQLVKRHCDYWCDSGTLLGLIRDGCLIEGDNDIDIGVFGKDNEKLQSIASIVKKDKGEVFLGFLNGKVFKYKLKIKKFDRIIDINVFRNYGSNFWCPQPVTSDQLRSRKFLCRGVNRISKKIRQQFSLVKAEYNKFPWNYIRNINYWCVPKEHLEKIEEVEIEGEKFKVPKEVKKYLSLRYSNWEIRNSGWDFQKDDGLLVRSDLPPKNWT